MAILRPMNIPSLGLPTQITAPSRQKKSMAQPDFYQQQTQPPQPDFQMQQDAITSNTGQRPDQPQFQQAPMTGDYIKSQLESYAKRTANPQLTPGSRVQAPNEQLVNPANFQSFYDRLSTTAQLGDDMLGAATAKAAFAKNKALNDILSKQIQAPGSIALKGAPGGTGGQNFGSGVPSNPKANFTFAQQAAPSFGWDDKELGAWYTLGMKESGWNSNAQNPTSTAYGIGQFLDSTWKGVGGSKTSDPRQQVQYMAQYIKNRYGSPSRALAFHIAHNWY